VICQCYAWRGRSRKPRFLLGLRDAIFCFDAFGQVSYLFAVRRSFFSNGHRHAGEVLLEKDSSGAGVNTADKTTRRGLNRRGRVMRYGKPFFKTSHVPCGPFRHAVVPTWTSKNDLAASSRRRTIAAALATRRPRRILRISFEFDQLRHFEGQFSANKIALVEIAIELQKLYSKFFKLHF